MVDRAVSDFNLIESIEAERRWDSAAWKSDKCGVSGLEMGVGMGMGMLLVFFLPLNPYTSSSFEDDDEDSRRKN